MPSTIFRAKGATAARIWAGSLIGGIWKKPGATWLAWPGKWQGRYPKRCDWVEDRIEQTCSFYRLPRQHHRHVKPTNMLERFNQEIKRRTHIARTFPNGASCPRLVRALAVETHEEWLEAARYLNMQVLKEHKKEQPRALDAA